MCLGVRFLGSNFFGTLWASWTSWTSISFARLGKFCDIICSNKFSISCSYSSSPGTPMIWILERLKISLRFLRLSSFFWILVSSFRSSWMFICFYWSKPLIWVLVSVLSPLVPCTFSFISLFIAFTFSCILWPCSTISVSILITSVLNSACDRLPISSSLHSLFGVLNCSFIWAIFFVSVCLLCSKGHSLK